MRSSSWTRSVVEASKEAAYHALVQRRKACRLCSGMENPSEVSSGSFNSDEIGPWTRWLGDPNARVLLVGQEWGDKAAFLRQQGLDSPNSATNRLLRELLASVGVEVPEISDGAADVGVFLTNAALCLKSQGCQGPGRTEWFTNCGQHFLRPQIELVRPKVVITIGERAYRGLTQSFQIAGAKQFRDAVESPGVELPNGSVLVPVYHCSRRVLNTHRPKAQQFLDWARVWAYL